MTPAHEKLYEHFLVLGIRTQVFNKDYPNSLITFPESFPEASSVVYSLVKVQYGAAFDDILSHAMWLISSLEAIPLREGLHYAHAIETLLPVLPFCIAQAFNEGSVLPLSHKVFNRLALPISLEQLVEQNRDEVEEFYGHEEEFRIQFGTCKIEDFEKAKFKVPFLKQYVIDEDFRRGCSYLHLSMTELGVDACDWAIHDYDQSFYRFVTVSRAESAFLNAFKVVEAIVGEPSKNRTRKKLEERLSRKGIDPAEEVGYRNNKVSSTRS